MARRRRHEEHENHERWLVSYADFITLLFAFFVVLYATSQSDLEKQEEFEESIKKEFMGALGGLGSGQGSGSSEFQSGRPDLLADVFPSRRASPEEVQDYVERKLEHQKSDQSENGPVTGVYHDALGVRIQVAANRLFSSGSADLKASSVKGLDEIGRLLKESNRRIIIEGHTDDEPIRTEKYPSNWELSASRATKVVRYLIARHKISASKITAVAYADQKPVAPNTSQENRSRNRRIEIMIVTDPSAP